MNDIQVLNIVITVEDAKGENPRDVRITLKDSLPVSTLVDILVKHFGWKNLDKDGSPLIYALKFKERPNETFFGDIPISSVGILNGERIVLGWIKRQPPVSSLQGNEKAKSESSPIYSFVPL